MENFLAEKKVAKLVTAPVDGNTAAITGGRVDMKNLKRVAFIVALAAGTTTTTHGFTLRQHDAASAGNSKDLLVDNPYYHKVGVATAFTKVQSDTLAATYNLHAVLADSASVVVFEVLAEQLDVNGAFRYASLDIADTGGAQLVSVIALGDSEYAPAYLQVI